MLTTFLSFEMLLIFSLLLLSAFFSSSETALTSISKAYVLKKSENNKSAKILKKMLDKPNKLITTLLVGNNISNVFFTTLITSAFIKHFGNNHTLALATGITILVLIFAEILPKTYAFTHINKTALILSPLVYITTVILMPVTFVFIKINEFFMGFSNSKNTDKQASLLNLRGAIELLQRQNSLIENKEIFNREKNMLHGVLDLHELIVGEIMNHRKNVFGININDDIEKIINDVINCSFNRVIVYDNKLDNIVGTVSVKQIFKSYKLHGINFKLQDLISKPFFIPDNTSVISTLHKLKDNKERMAVVVDEYGSFMGILTFSDIINEVTGDIELNESELLRKKIRKEADNSYIVDGDITIRDLNRYNNWNLPDDEFTTLAGLILYETGKIPNVGNIFVCHGFKFVILEKIRHQLVKIKIIPLEE